MKRKYLNISDFVAFKEYLDFLREHGYVKLVAGGVVVNSKTGNPIKLEDFHRLVDWTQRKAFLSGVLF